MYYTPLHTLPYKTANVAHVLLSQRLVIPGQHCQVSNHVSLTGSTVQWQQAQLDDKAVPNLSHSRNIGRDNNTGNQKGMIAKVSTR